jgi:hypothetical protein
MIPLRCNSKTSSQKKILFPAPSTATKLTYSLLGEHSLESVKVIEARAELLGGKTLSPVRLVPLANSVSLLHSLGDGLGASTTEDGDGQVGQVKTLEGEDLTGNTVSGAIDEGAVGVEDVNDDDELTMVITLVDNGNTVRRIIQRISTTSGLTRVARTPKQLWVQQDAQSGPKRSKFCQNNVPADLDESAEDLRRLHDKTKKRRK